MHARLRNHLSEMEYAIRSMAPLDVNTLYLLAMASQYALTLSAPSGRSSMDLLTQGLELCVGLKLVAASSPAHAQHLMAHAAGLRAVLSEEWSGREELAPRAARARLLHATPATTLD